MKKKLGIIIVVVLVVIYAVGVGVFSFFTYPKTKINDINIGFTSKKEILDSDYSNYKLETTGKDDSKNTFAAKDIDYTVSIPKGTKVEQNGILWPVDIFKGHSQKIDYNQKWNDEKLESLIDELNKNAVEPEDAKIERKNDKFEIAKEVEGNKLDMNSTKKAILAAFEFKKDELNLEDEYLKPKVLSDSEELKEKVELMNSLFNISITFNFGTEKEELVGETMVELYDNEDGKYKLNDEKVTAYITNLATKYNTFGKEHKFNATGVGEVKVPGGIYGWQLDITKTADLLKKQIDAGKSGTIDPEYKQTGLGTIDKGVGNTYVEVDLTRQHLWFYKDGALVVDTDIITGLPTADRETPVGTFKIWSRETNRNLTGEDYSSPVKIWMPINWTGIGLHDASWQSSFGGALYKTLGSRGCVNIPYEKVKAVYDGAKINTPVLVYKS